MTLDLSRKDWTIFARTEGGKMALTRNLTLAEAAACKKIMQPYRTGPWEPHDSDIVSVTVVGPEGWDGCMKAASHDYSRLTPDIWHGNGPGHGLAICFGHCANCREHFWFWGDTALARGSDR